MMRFQRRQRTTFTKEQLDALQEAFRKTHYPEADYRDHLAKVTKLNSTKIQVWFQNQRAKERKRRFPELDSPPNINHITGTLAETNQIVRSHSPSEQHQQQLFYNIKGGTCSSTVHRKTTANTIHMFTSSMANEAAMAVTDGKYETIIDYHRKTYAGHIIGSPKSKSLSTSQVHNDGNNQPKSVSYPQFQIFDLRQKDHPTASSLPSPPPPLPYAATWMTQNM